MAAISASIKVPAFTGMRRQQSCVRPRKQAAVQQSVAPRQRRSVAPRAGLDLDWSDPDTITGAAGAVLGACHARAAGTLARAAAFAAAGRAWAGMHAHADDLQPARPGGVLVAPHPFVIQQQGPLSLSLVAKPLLPLPPSSD